MRWIYTYDIEIRLTTMKPLEMQALRRFEIASG
jgi:hypothetical protein